MKKNGQKKVIVALMAMCVSMPMVGISAKAVEQNIMNNTTVLQGENQKYLNNTTTIKENQTPAFQEPRTDGLQKPVNAPKPRLTRKAQKITAKNITKNYGDNGFQVNVKTNGDGKLTYTIGNKKVATISKKGKVKLKGYGVTNITIRAARTEKYKAAKKKITLTVLPKLGTLQKISKLSSEGRMIVEWKKDSKASGYILEYATNEQFQDAKKIPIDNNNTIEWEITDFEEGKRHYIRVRAYKTFKGKKLYGKYSSVMDIEAPVKPEPAPAPEPAPEPAATQTVDGYVDLGPFPYELYHIYNDGGKDIYFYSEADVANDDLCDQLCDQLFELASAQNPEYKNFHTGSLPAQCYNGVWIEKVGISMN